jgi:hypothetical protein
MTRQAYFTCTLTSVLGGGSGVILSVRHTYVQPRVALSRWHLPIASTRTHHLPAAAVRASTIEQLTGGGGLGLPKGVPPNATAPSLVPFSPDPARLLDPPASIASSPRFAVSALVSMCAPDPADGRQRSPRSRGMADIPATSSNALSASLLS